MDASPFSVVHLDLAEGSKDPADPGSRYARAAELLQEWERVGALTRAAEPLFAAATVRCRGRAWRC